MDDATERWLPIPGYEDLYEVSDLGRVRSNYFWRGTSRRILALASDGYGYLQVTLSRNGKTRTRKVHQLVMLAFAGPPPLGMEVRHGPRGRLDNRLISLCYGTRAENIADRLRDGWINPIDTRGEKNGRAKLNAAAASAIRQRIAAGESYGSVARSLCVGTSTIGRVVRGECWNDGLVT
jgi:NUMOD4 motif/HNH endonuclease